MKISNCGHSWTPKRGLDLKKLSKQLTDSLAKETKESLTEWLKGKRDKLYTREEVIEFTLKCLDYFKPMQAAEHQQQIDDSTSEIGHDM
jgi:hypothetical protein